MGDNEHRAPFHSAPASSWDQIPHVYPHSHHGTPAQEYAGFSFTTPQYHTNQNSYATEYHQRSMHQQLQPLVMPQVMPQWPSMLNNSRLHSTFQPVYPQAVQPLQAMQMPTPVSASSTRSTSTPRKTLTDVDRKRMCQYADENPNAKQTEIGGMRSMPDVHDRS
jgi:hypothetical protein